MTKSEQARITDVASLAGVSPATASRVMSGTTRVGKERRKRVLAAARKLDYQPNRVARNLRRGQTRIIAVVVSDIDNPHSAEFVRDAESVAYERGYRLLLCNIETGSEKQASYLRTLAEERVAGVVLSASDPTAREISQLLDLGIAVVAVERPVGDSRADAVTMDNVGGGRMATAHLLSLGHRDVAFIGGPAESSTARGRLAGYRETMAAAGLRARWECGAWDVVGGRGSMSKLLSDGDAPSAIVAANNLITIGILSELRERRLAIPGNVAIVAFDDPLWADVVHPPLTTLRQPIGEIAQRAVGLLLSRIEKLDVATFQDVLEFEFVHRRSCGCKAGPRSGK